MFKRTVQDDAKCIKHSSLRQVGWQLRVGGVSVMPQRDFVIVVVADFMARIPHRWRLVMLELNCDIYDASKKLVVGSVNASKRTIEETAQMRRTTLEDLRDLMQQRVQ